MAVVSKNIVLYKVHWELVPVILSAGIGITGGIGDNLIGRNTTIGCGIRRLLLK